MTATTVAEDDIDRSLFARHLSGDDAAMVELFERHNHRLYLYCLKLVGSAQAAEDLTQELWEKVVRLRAESTSVRNPVGYFVRIARNLALNYLRGRRRLSPLDDHSAAVENRHQTEPEDERSEAIAIALNRLPFEYREVLILSAYSGYSHGEIAQMLGKSPEAIWKRASRARGRLREIVLELVSDSSIAPVEPAGGNGEN